MNIVGLEKSGAFVEHAMRIEKALGEALDEALADGPIAGAALPLSNEYIYKYVVPGDPGTIVAYGENTYWGGKIIFKAADRSIYVATVPTLGGHNPAPQITDYLCIENVLSIVAEL